jgi:hypothetical protein
MIAMAKLAFDKSDNDPSTHRLQQLAAKVTDKQLREKGIPPKVLAIYPIPFRGMQSIEVSGWYGSTVLLSTSERTMRSEGPRLVRYLSVSQ